MRDELGTKTLGAVLSLTPGEIHLRELKRQTRSDELDPGQSLTVLALGADGVPIHVDLGLARKWSTRGWEVQLACPLCKEPSREGVTEQIEPTPSCPLSQACSMKRGP